MKILPSKQIVSTVILSCSLLFTFNTAATETSFEHVLASTIKAQGKKAISDISTELSNAISADLEHFSLRYEQIKSQAFATVLTTEITQQKNVKEK